MLDQDTIVLTWGHFFCSTAPQAFFRPDRKARMSARADTVKVGRSYAATVGLGLDSVEHDGHARDVGPDDGFPSLTMVGKIRASSSVDMRSVSVDTWVTVLYAVGGCRRNIRSETQPLQCPQRARVRAARPNGFRRNCLHLRPEGNASGSTRSSKVTNGSAR